MMRVLIEMLIRRRLEIRFGTMAEEGDSSVITSCSVLANDYIIYGKNGNIIQVFEIML